MFLWYEELAKNLPNVVQRLASFLGCCFLAVIMFINLGCSLSEDVLQKICKKASFEEMKVDREARVADFWFVEPRKFFRSGTNKTWKEVFTFDQIEQMNSKLNEMKENFYNDIDLFSLLDG